MIINHPHLFSNCHQDSSLRVTKPDKIDLICQLILAHWSDFLSIEGPERKSSKFNTRNDEQVRSSPALKVSHFGKIPVLRKLTHMLHLFLWDKSIQCSMFLWSEQLQKKQSHHANQGEARNTTCQTTHILCLRVQMMILKTVQMVVIKTIYLNFP